MMLTPEELSQYNASLRQNDETSTATIGKPTIETDNIACAKHMNENSNDRISAMEAKMEATLSSMQAMMATMISSQQLGGNTQPRTQNQSMALQNVTPPFQTPIKVNVGLAGKSKTHVTISSPETKELLTVPIEFLENCDDVLTVSGQRKRKQSADNGSQSNAQCVVAQASDQNVGEQRQKWIQRCRQCGHKSTPGNPVVNKACIHHINYGRTYKRMNQRQKRQDRKVGRSCLPLVGIDGPTMNKFERLIAYQRDIMIPSCQLAGFYAGLIEELGTFKCLKKHGLAYVSILVSISHEEGEFLHHAMSNWDWDQQLFTAFDENDGQEKFLHNIENNRWVTTKDHHITFVCQWNHLESKVAQ